MDATTLWLAVPHRSQYDNSPYAETNCGPASLGMVLDSYGLRYATDPLRREVNRAQGNSDPDEGTALPAIAEVGRRAGLHPVGLYSRPGVFKRWTLAELREQVEHGRPVMTLVRYAALPGATVDLGFDHYIVLSGLAGDQFIYNDSSQPQGRGAGLLISREALQRAWQTTIIFGHAVAFARTPDGAGLFAAAPVEEGEEAAEAEEAAEEAGSRGDSAGMRLAVSLRPIVESAYFDRLGEPVATLAPPRRAGPMANAPGRPPWWMRSELMVPLLALVGVTLPAHIALALRLRAVATGSPGSRGLPHVEAPASRKVKPVGLSAR